MQKVVKESGLINKAKKSFKSKITPEASATPEVNVFPGKDFSKIFCFSYKYLVSVFRCKNCCQTIHLQPIYTTLFSGKN